MGGAEQVCQGVLTPDCPQFPGTPTCGGAQLLHHWVYLDKELVL